MHELYENIVYVYDRWEIRNPSGYATHYDSTPILSPGNCNTEAFL